MGGFRTEVGALISAIQQGAWGSPDQGTDQQAFGRKTAQDVPVRVLSRVITPLIGVIIPPITRLFSAISGPILSSSEDLAMFETHIRFTPW